MWVSQVFDDLPSPRRPPAKPVCCPASSGEGTGSDRAGTRPSMDPARSTESWDSGERPLVPVPASAEARVQVCVQDKQRGTKGASEGRSAPRPSQAWQGWFGPFLRRASRRSRREPAGRKTAPSSGVCMWILVTRAFLCLSVPAYKRRLWRRKLPAFAPGAGVSSQGAGGQLTGSHTRGPRAGLFAGVRADVPVPRPDRPVAPALRHMRSWSGPLLTAPRGMVRAGRADPGQTAVAFRLCDPGLATSLL